jgi:hypothetical protein
MSSAAASGDNLSGCSEASKPHINCQGLAWEGNFNSEQIYPIQIAKNFAIIYELMG